MSGTTGKKYNSNQNNQKSEFEYILKNFSRHMPLCLQIEFNITGFKGYDGINIPRDHNAETSIDVQKKLLAMDSLDGKITPMMHAYYEAELAVKENLLKLRDIKYYQRN